MYRSVLSLTKEFPEQVQEVGSATHFIASSIKLRQQFQKKQTNYISTITSISVHILLLANNLMTWLCCIITRIKLWPHWAAPMSRRLVTDWHIFCDSTKWTVSLRRSTVGSNHFFTESARLSVAPVRTVQLHVRPTACSSQTGEQTFHLRSFVGVCYSSFSKLV